MCSVKARSISERVWFCLTSAPHVPHPWSYHLPVKSTHFLMKTMYIPDYCNLLDPASPIKKTGESPKMAHIYIYIYIGILLGIMQFFLLAGPGYVPTTVSICRFRRLASPLRVSASHRAPICRFRRSSASKPLRCMSCEASGPLEWSPFGNSTVWYIDRRITVDMDIDGPCNSMTFHVFPIKHMLISIDICLVTVFSPSKFFPHYNSSIPMGIEYVILYWMHWSKENTETILKPKPLGCSMLFLLKGAKNAIKHRDGMMKSKSRQTHRLLVFGCGAGPHPAWLKMAQVLILGWHYSNLGLWRQNLLGYSQKCTNEKSDKHGT